VTVPLELGREGSLGGAFWEVGGLMLLGMGCQLLQLKGRAVMERSRDRLDSEIYFSGLHIM
jgi:hypothetical protein